MCVQQLCMLGAAPAAGRACAAPAAGALLCGSPYAGPVQHAARCAVCIMGRRGAGGMRLCTCWQHVCGCAMPAGRWIGMCCRPTRASLPLCCCGVVVVLPAAQGWHWVAPVALAALSWLLLRRCASDIIDGVWSALVPARLVSISQGSARLCCCRHAACWRCC